MQRISSTVSTKSGNASQRNGRGRAQAFRCQVIQQTLLPVFEPLFGSNEHRLPGSPYWAVQQLNARLRRLADTAGVDIMAMDAVAAVDGLAAWHDPALWLRAKQEVHPSAAPAYGDRMVRLLAAGLGRSSKALVLDLDNTLWGGVIGDDGMEGIKLGQGSAAGEAFAAFQRYARRFEPARHHPRRLLQERYGECDRTV